MVGRKSEVQTIGNEMTMPNTSNEPSVFNGVNRMDMGDQIVFP